MRCVITWLCWLVFAPALFVCAAPPETPKEPLKLAVGEDSVVTIKVAKDKQGAFRAAFSDRACTFFRGYETPGSGEMTFLVRPKVAGDHRVVFWTVGEAESSVLVILAGKAPTPPGPDPPIPPDPPGPDPDPDPVLTAELQRAFDQEPAGSRVSDLDDYRKLLLAVPETIKLKAWTTAELSAKIREKRKELIAERLPHVRAAVDRHLKAVLPTEDQPVTGTLANQIAALYTRLGTSLGRVTP
jgi:hypothetical protein